MESSAKTYQSPSEKVTASPQETLCPAFELFKKKWTAKERPTSVQNARKSVHRDQCFAIRRGIFSPSIHRKSGQFHTRNQAEGFELLGRVSGGHKKRVPYR